MKKILSLLLVALLVGCGQNTGGGTEDYEKIYAPVVEELKAVVESKGVDFVPSDMATHESIAMMSGDEIGAAPLMGYVIQDFIGDEKPELVVANISEEEDGKLYGDYVNEIYTIVDGKAKLFTETAFLDFMLILEGRSVFKYQSLDIEGIKIVAKSENGKFTPELIYKQSYDIENSKVAYQKDQDNSMETEDFVDVDITDDELTKMIDSYGQSIRLELKQIVETGNVGEFLNDRHSYYAEDELVYISEFDESIDYPAEAKEFEASGSRHAVKVVLDPTTELKDFKIMQIVQYYDAGTIDYSVEKILHEMGTVNPETPVIIQLEIPEFVSYTAISFVDNQGSTRFFAICESGEDGSLYMEEIYPSFG